MRQESGQSKVALPLVFQLPNGHQFGHVFAGVRLGRETAIGPVPLEEFIVHERIQLHGLQCAIALLCHQGHLFADDGLVKVSIVFDQIGDPCNIREFEGRILIIELL